MSSTSLDQIEALLNDLTREQQLHLMEKIADRLRLTETPRSRSLYGIWRDKFPADLDIDQALNQIRQDWQRWLELPLNE